jgi:predicted nucleic acid-binding protein
MIVVADTTPINYLILIRHINVLPALYQRIIVPEAVVDK